MKIFFILFIGLLGLLIGSFLNVLIYRLPEAQDIFFRPSSCTQCQQKIKWYHNIPLVSFVALKGKCAYCQVAISWSYPLVEFLSVALSAYCAWYFYPDVAHCISALLFTYFLIVLVMIDVNTFLLPDSLTLSLLWLGLIINTQQIWINLAGAVLGAAVGYTFLWLLSKTYQSVRHQEGMGAGDWKLFAAFGAWFGWRMLPFILFLASISAVFFILLRWKFKKVNLQTPIAFGPFLALAAWLLLFTTPNNL